MTNKEPDTNELRLFLFKNEVIDRLPDWFIPRLEKWVATREAEAYKKGYIARGIDELLKGDI